MQFSYLNKCRLNMKCAYAALIEVLSKTNKKMYGEKISSINGVLNYVVSKEIWINNKMLYRYKLHIYKIFRSARRSLVIC